MNILEVEKIKHGVKVGDTAPEIEANIKEDTIFSEKGVGFGFYIRNISGNLKKYIEIANAEFKSSRVPKSMMGRSKGSRDNENQVKQYSTIIGSVQPRPHMRRPYPSISSVHQQASAKHFIKAMLLACRELDTLIKDLIPEAHEAHMKAMEEIPETWRFGKMFTSSISNYNISADYHVDGGNLKPCLNAIIVKKRDARGGNTTVPDYGATVDSCDNSLLVYPAWKNIHGVTPIQELSSEGYRNSLVFYSLKAFKGL